jgi:hypothetical protein
MVTLALVLKVPQEIRQLEYLPSFLVGEFLWDKGTRRNRKAAILLPGVQIQSKVAVIGILLDCRETRKAQVMVLHFGHLVGAGLAEEIL